jgi:outer membrane protein OmpA-like peptidoglycan-associated protein/Tol biopolymer transport system component
MRCYSVFFFLLTFSLSLWTQSPAKPFRSKDLKELAAVQSLMTLERYDEANTRLDKLTKRYPESAELHYLSAEMDRGQGNYDSAIAAIDRGLDVDTGDKSYGYRLRAETLTAANRYVEALDSYRDYLQAAEAAGRPQSVRKAEEMLGEARLAADLAADPYPFEPTPLGAGVNTPGSLEYFPSLSVDGQRLIFTRRVERKQEDFFQSIRLADGTWDQAVPLPGVNTPMNEGAQSITADGRYLVFTGCGRRDGMGSCDLYESRWLGNRWSRAENIGPAINTRASESQPSLSRDGQLLFFASNRTGGLGKDDLYVSGRRPDGSWSQPVNLGTSVNTAGNDRYPFWAADNRTLFFTSTGRPGLGGADLFRTEVGAGNKWKEPVNLGYPINTSGEETNLFVALDGKTAFFSKGIDRDVDIYTFNLPEKHRPTPATYVEVEVVDDETGEPLQAEVRLHPLRQEGSVSSRPTDAAGRYVTVLPLGVDYGFAIDKPGYLFYSDRFVLTGAYSVDEPFRLNVRLKPVTEDVVSVEAEEDGAIALRNVFFETASAELLDISTEELDRLVALLANQPGVGVEIAGHTDGVGSDSENLELSERRAAAVAGYLREKGIEADRISVVGYGESRPVASNDTEAGRAQNRRTTFRLLF